MPGSAIGKNGDDAEILASARWSAASEVGINMLIHDLSSIDDRARLDPGHLPIALRGIALLRDKSL